jgi:hypothetical protein
MSQIDLDRLASALKLTPAQRAHLESLASAAQANGGDAAAPPPQNADLRIHLTPGVSLDDGDDAARARAQHDPLTAAAFARLSPELRRALRDIEPQVLKWINASKANALLFTTDPLGALRKAVPRLDRNTLDALTSLRAASADQAAGMPAFPGVNLQSITVDAKPFSPSFTQAEPPQKAQGAVRRGKK